jgi:hypothetical protein
MAATRRRRIARNSLSCWVMNLTERQYRKGNAIVASGTAIRMAGVKQALMTAPVQRECQGNRELAAFFPSAPAASNFVFRSLG